MALDGITLYFTARELREKLTGARVEKISQPSRLELVLNMRTRNGPYKLLFSAEPSSARVHITEFGIENPSKPPMLCMLLRKKLTGAVLRGIRQSGLDRILFFDFDAFSEIGDRVRLSLCAELMAQHGNIILMDGDGRIIDAVKRVDSAKSSARRILPSFPYVLPPQPDKLDIRFASAEKVESGILTFGDEKLCSALLHSVQGISPVVCRELVFRAFGCDDAPVAELKNEAASQRFREVLTAFQADLNAGRVCPQALFDTENKPFELSFTDVRQYGGLFVRKRFPTFCKLLDAFYFERGRAVRMRAKARDLFKILSNATGRISKKINIRRGELDRCADRERLRTCAELIAANQYRLKGGAAFYEVENYYDNNSLLHIPVDPALSPAKNSQRYYREYKRASAAEKVLEGLIEEGRRELEYIETVRDALERADSEAELTELRDELMRGGYIKKRADIKSCPAKALPPLAYRTSEGFAVLVGRNNLQNDRLTFKTAKNYDLWFHVQGLAGSHAVMLCEKRPFTELAVSEAAIIAACNSSAGENTKVPVDYTLVKNVKKPPGAPPGKVIYNTYGTIYVLADKSKIAEKKSG